MTQMLVTPKLQATPEEIIGLLIRMGREVEIAVDQAIEALIHCDDQLVADIPRRETVINKMEMNVDQAVFAALKDGHLTELEIRSVASILKINKDLERLGDLASNIARIVCRLATQHRTLNSAGSELQPLAIAVHHVCRQTLRALHRQDLTLASNALVVTASVDTYRDYAFQRLCERNDSSVASDAMTLLLSSRYLEQIADHATDLAENLVRFLQSKSEGAPNARDGQWAS